MAQLPLQPKATAVWLVENTTLTFEQIAEFTGMHPLEVQAIADAEPGMLMVGVDPVANGQIHADELTRAQADPDYRMKLRRSDLPEPKSRTRGPRYTPISRRQDKPDAILWLLKNVPQMSDAAICRLIGTTKTTIAAIRDRTHWNISAIKAVNPVALDLCRDEELARATAEAIAQAEAKKASGKPVDPPQTKVPLDDPLAFLSTSGGGGKPRGES